MNGVLVLAFPDPIHPDEAKPLIDSMEKSGYVLLDSFEVRGRWEELYFYLESNHAKVHGNT